MAKYDLKAMFNDLNGLDHQQMSFLLGGLIQRMEIKGVLRKKDIKEMAAKAKVYKLRV